MAGASLEGCRTAVGSTLLPPFTEWGYNAAARGVPCPRPKTKTFPSPDKVLRLPAEMQLKQLIF